MKKLFAILGLTLCVGLACPKPTMNVVRAEETTSESYETPNDDSSSAIVDSSDIESAEETFNEISQQAQDTIAIIKSILNQPIVIGGYSITLGVAILLGVKYLLKAIQSAKDKGQKSEDIVAIESKVEEQEKEIAQLKATNEKYESALLSIAGTIKNTNVKESVVKMFKVEEIVENKEDNKVLEIVSETANSVLKDIINKD